MSLDTTTLQTSLTTRIASLTGSESPETLLALTAALDSLTTNRMLSVANIASLPNLITNPLPSGSLVFVEEYNIIMMSVGTVWKGIDGRGSFGPQRLTYAWGLNTNGRLGDNSVTTRSSPVTVVGSIGNWSQLSAGGQHSLGLTTTGIAYAWGRNTTGELGTNNTSSHSSPVTVVGGITNWSQVSAGYSHSIGLTSTGIAYAWGSGSYGKLGDDTTSNRSSPITVIGGITNWSQVSAGLLYNLGLTSTGIAYGWGYNTNAQLADGTTTSRRSPVTIVGGITNWSRLAGGRSHGLGLTTTGVAYAWGQANYGKLGDNTAINKSSPVTVVGGITNWSQVSGGRNHSLGLTATGIAYGWGGLNGAIGDNTTSNRSSPVTVVGGITNWSQVSAGYIHSLGLTTTGIAYAWGSNADGRLGDNTTSGRSSPVTIAGGLTNWGHVAGGYKHSLAIFAS